MTGTQAPHYVWFKLLLIVGSLLGLLLVVQSIRNYRFVSQRLVREQLRRDAVRQVTFVERHARQAAIRDPADLGKLLEEVRGEAEQQIAWIRLIDRNGEVLAESGDAVGPPVLPGDLRLRRDSGEDGSEMRQTPSGEVLVTVLPFRYRFGNRRPGFGQRPPPGGPPRPGVMEMALFTEGAAVEFRGLRQNLIVSLSAALALVASMVLLALRFRHYLRGRQLEQQLELARRVQQDLLPPECPSFGNLDVAAECVPAWQVGGDFYDVFSGDRGRIAMLVGDVSGKGLPAALLMGLLHGAVRSTSWIGTGSEHEESSRRLNQLLCMRTSAERFASLFWCHYDPETRELCYVNAGHLAPMIAARNGDDALEIRRLEEGGPALGVLPAAQYRQGETELLPGDLMVMYSDGVVEATNAAEEEFGEDRLTSAIHETWGRSSREIRDEILSRVRSFLGNEQAHDDLTVLIVRVGETSSHDA
jgi:serine phosphatase RsbU (regulator of sigma subunit)